MVQPCVNKEQAFRLGPFWRRGRKVEELRSAVPDCGAKLQARVIIDPRIRRPCSGRRRAIRSTMVSYRVYFQHSAPSTGTLSHPLAGEECASVRFEK